MSYQSSKIYKVTSNYIIGKYQQGNGDSELAMTETITFNTLQNKITHCGFGTGIYGFVNYEETKNYTHTYNVNGVNNSGSLDLLENLNKFNITHFELKNPVILEKLTIDGNEEYSDLGHFNWLLTNLNMLCYELYNNKKSINEQNIIEIFNKNNFFQNTHNCYEGIPNVSITINDIIWVVRSFLHDYNYLMTLNEQTEYYMLMPINYLMYRYEFDGIFNKCDDSGKTSSVKYFFSNDFSNRGFRSKFKRRKPLGGNLIFLH